MADEIAKPPGPIIKVIPGSLADAEREACFNNMQLALAGAKLGSALAAQIDSLACTIVVLADDKANAAAIIDSIHRDLTKAAADNWDSIKDQLAAMPARSGGTH